MKYFVIAFVIATFTFGICSGETTSATNLFVDIYDACLSKLSISCIKPKALSWLSKNIEKDEIKLTSDLSIIRTGNDQTDQTDQTDDTLHNRSKSFVGIELYNKIDKFLTYHSLKLNAPEVFKTDEARSVIPSSFLEGGLVQGLEIPLSDGNAVEGRGFVKKVIIPFLLGLKFKTTILVPITLALIALKTWKAMTFGLLSLVLSGALLIFKIAKPKIVNYEVVHYPHHHVDHIIPHHIEHIPHHIEHIPHHIEHIPHHIDHIPHHIEHVPPHIEHIPHHVEHVDHITHHDHIPHSVEHIEHGSPVWDHHGWARSSINAVGAADTTVPKDAQEMAYAGQR